MKIIGISGVARSGKDTLAKCLQIKLAERGFKVAIRSLAAPLKEHLAEFVLKNFGIDIWNCSDAEKEIIRPLMVAYGGAKRKQTMGTFWTLQMDVEIQRLKKDGYQYVLIPDVRYCVDEYPEDELKWLQNKEGVLFHVKKKLGDGSFLEPPNDDERANDPKLHDAADYRIEWPEQPFSDCLDLAMTLRLTL